MPREMLDFPPALDTDMWRPLLEAADYPVHATDSDDLLLKRLSAESAIRDVLIKYCYAYDANDIDRLESVFRHDSVIINPRGTFRGLDSIRDNYLYLFSTRRYSFHHVTNITVRVNREIDAAFIASYFTDKHVDHTGSIGGTDGTYIDKMEKDNGVWSIVERRISANIAFVLPSYPEPWPAPPMPSDKQSTRYWFAKNFMR